MVKFLVREVRNAKARAFTQGVVTGLSAPALLLAGALDAPIAVRRTTINDSTAKASSAFRSGVHDFRRLTARRV